MHFPGIYRIPFAAVYAPDKAFGDGLATAKGSDGKPLPRNSQTLLNVGHYSKFFWDGRAATLEEQALIPIQSSVEMNQNLDELEEELNAVPGYAEQFQAVFDARVSRDGIARALAAFQRTLTTRDSPLDRYLNGDKQALSPSARRGLELFRGDAGCVRCHHGPLLSDEKFYRLGVSFIDKGRGDVTKQADDSYKFRTPSLRDVARTAPYMHNGSLASLQEVVQFYFRDAPTRGPDGLSLDIEPLFDRSFSEMTDLVEFLKALSGEPPKITAPELP